MDFNVGVRADGARALARFDALIALNGEAA
jgi:hypothetical protein